MVDSDLVDELDVIAAQVGGITKLQTDPASAYVQGLAEAYVADPANLRWWESLKVHAERLNYGDADGLSQLAMLVGHHNSVMLVVTDDEEPPWPVYEGEVGKVMTMLRGGRFFEYILAAPDMSWIIFDTHMNELVCAGHRGA